MLRILLLGVVLLLERSQVLLLLVLHLQPLPLQLGVMHTGALAEVPDLQAAIRPGWRPLTQHTTRHGDDAGLM